MIKPTALLYLYTAQSKEEEKGKGTGKGYLEDHESQHTQTLQKQFLLLRLVDLDRSMGGQRFIESNQFKGSL